MKPLLEIKNLNINYKNSIKAVKNVSLTLEDNQIISIVGESGSGKSTLIRAILKLLPMGGEIESGNIFFLEKDSELYNNILSELSDKAIFVIGGANTYKEFLDNEDISEIYISTILEDYSSNADSKFPDIDWEEWKLVYEENHKDFIHQKWVNKIISILI